MKVFSKILTVFLIATIVLTLGACKKKSPKIIDDPITEQNILGDWADGGDGVYTLDTNTSDELSFSYSKSTFTYGSLIKELTEDLSIFKKLVVTVEGSGTMLLKLETDTGASKEISLNVTGIAGSYEWNLINDSEFLGNVTKAVIISAPGKVDSVGEITIKKLEFSVDVAENFIIQTDFNNIPQNVVEYDGTGTTFDFNTKWENFSEEVYTVTYNGAAAEVAFDKGAGLEWSTLKVSVQGDFSSFNYIVLKVSGTEGQKLLAKPSDFGAFENFVFLTSDQQELVLDISGMTAAEKNAITEIFLFGAAGLAPVTGSFVIHEAFFAEEYEYTAPVIDKNVFESGDSFSLTHWYDGGDNNYTIEKSGLDTIITYDKTGEWTYAIAHIEGDLSQFEKVIIEVTGVENKTALLKIEGTAGVLEEAVTFDGTKQTFTIDLTVMSIEQRQAINKFLIFAAQGSAIGSGTITIHSLTFVEGGLSVNDLWVDNGDGAHTISFADGVATVVYDKLAGQEWTHIKTEFDPLLVDGLNTLTLVLDGTSGKQVLVKPNDDGALEQWVTFGDEPVTVVVTAESFTNIIIFAEAGTASVSGTFEILETKLDYVAPAVDPLLSLDFTEGEFVENDLGTYTFTVADGTTVVDYVKGAGQEWVFGKIEFDPALVAGLNTMTLVLDGTSGKEVLLKPNDDGALEQWVTFGDEPVVVVVTAESFSKLMFFAEAGSADVTGQFTIISATLSDTITLTNWVDNGDGAHTITVVDGVTTVAYDKLAGQEWTHIKIEFDPLAVDGLNTLTLVLDGTPGKQVLVKPNDNGSLEQWVTFGDDPITILVKAESFTNIILFAEAGTASVSGTFEILETRLGFVEPPVMELNSFDFTEGAFLENDLGTYTFTVVDGTTVVDYVKGAGQEWVFGKLDFDPLLTSGFNTMTLVLDGTPGKQVLVKPNDNGALEQWVTFGDDPIVVVVTAESFNNLIFFAEAGIADVSGQFTIVSATLSNTISLTNWVDNGDGAHTITLLDGVTTVAYDKPAGQEWTFVKIVFDPTEVAGLNTLILELSGTAGNQVLVKPNDDGALEQWVTFGDEPVTIMITADSFSNIILFAEAGTAPAVGTFEIIATRLGFVE